MPKDFTHIMPSIFKLNGRMLSKLEKWQDEQNRLAEKQKAVGGLTFSFTPGNIITNVKAYHHGTHQELDLTDYESM